MAGIVIGHSGVHVQTNVESLNMNLAGIESAIILSQLLVVDFVMDRQSKRNSALSYLVQVIYNLI